MNPKLQVGYLHNRVPSHDQACSTAFLPAEYRAVQASMEHSRLGLAFLARTFWLELKLSGKGFHASTGRMHFGTLCSRVNPCTSAASRDAGCWQTKADSVSSSRGAPRSSPHLDVLGYVHLTRPHVAQAAFLQEPALVVVVGNPGGDAQPAGLGAGTPGWGVHNAVLLPGFVLSLVRCGRRLTPHYSAQAALHMKRPLPSSLHIQATNPNN